MGNVANHGGIQKRKGLKERNAAGEADHRAAKKDIARTPTNQNDENMDVDCKLFISFLKWQINISARTNKIKCFSAGKYGDRTGIGSSATST